MTTGDIPAALLGLSLLLTLWGAVRLVRGGNRHIRSASGWAMLAVGGCALASLLLDDVVSRQFILMMAAGVALVELAVLGIAAAIGSAVGRRYGDGDRPG